MVRLGHDTVAGSERCAALCVCAARWRHDPVNNVVEVLQETIAVQQD
jgi:hypothetical protein